MAKTLLLADDSVTIQKVVELTFMDQDYEVVSVSDGDAALAKLGEGLTPDLVIADVHMPGTDGYTVCEQAKARFPSVPVLLMVGTFEAFDEQRAASCGADDHLKKPFDSQDLLQRAEQMIAAAAAASAAEAAIFAEPAAAEPAPAAEVAIAAPAEAAQRSVATFDMEDDPTIVAGGAAAAAPEPEPVFTLDADPA
ncbi:MAG: response regulator, partial [Acidobacteriota bacterium]